MKDIFVKQDIDNLAVKSEIKNNNENKIHIKFYSQ